MTTPPRVGSCRLNTDHIEAGAPVVISAEITGSWDNPDNPDEIEVWGQLITPTGEEQYVPGFLFQDFIADDQKRTLTPRGEPVWQVRYTPRVVGEFTITVQARSPLGAADREPLRFAVTEPAEDYRGFIGLNPGPDKTYYHYEHSGRTFYSFGLNLDVPTFTRPLDSDLPADNLERGLYGDGVNRPAAGATPENLWLIYDRYRQGLAKAAAAGVNTVRLRVDSRFLPLELFEKPDLPGYPNGVPGFSVGRYHAGHAWIADQVIALADTYGIAVQLCAWNGNHSSHFGDSTYARERDERLVKRRLRYDVARWGYSSSLLAWEYFNEFPREYNLASDDFWRAITEWLRGLDVNHHLITTSYHGIDTEETHGYLERPGDDFLSPYQDSRAMATFQWSEARPHVFSEYGRRRYHRRPVGEDPGGLVGRFGVWACLVGHWSGAWYWWMVEHLDPADLYHTIYAGIAAFVADEELGRYRWQPAGFASVSGSGLTYHGMTSTRRERTLAWIVRTPSHEETDRPPANENIVQLAHLTADADHLVEWWDPAKGTVLRAQTQTATETGVVTLTVPDGVTRDIALKVIRADSPQE